MVFQNRITGHVYCCAHFDEAAFAAHVGEDAHDWDVVEPDATTGTLVPIRPVMETGHG